MMVRSPPRSSPSRGAFALPTASVSRRRSGTLLISVLLQLVSCAFLLLLPAAEVIGTSNSSISSPHHVLAAHARRRSPPRLHYHQHGAGRVFSGGINKNIARCSESERAALLQFKAGLMLPDDNPPSNSTHARLSSWRGLDCCRGWEGVTCGNFTGGYVIKLDLRNWNLSSMMDTTAMFSPLLRLKSSLRYLDLSSNPFHQYKDHIPIPAFFGSFKELRYLNLSHTSFTGTVPPQLGNLSRLHYLDLSGGAPDGSSSLRVDSLQWVSGLSRLRYLSLDNVNLSSTATGALEWVQLLNERLPFLTELHLCHCSLDSIATSLDHTNFTSLKVFDLSSNHFSSVISVWLPNISNLVYLDLSNNDLRGPIPHGGFSQLRHLDLDYNRNLNASISELLGRHGDWPRINTLSMDVTNTFGEIPPSIGNITSLAWLSLYGNRIQGVIPSSIGKLRRLTALDLSLNSLSGELPPALWQLPELVRLDVIGNQLSGIVTEVHLSSLGAKLKTLGLGGNHLIVNLSSHWIPPFQLHHAYLQSCQLGPTFPSWIKSQRELTTIILGQNGISDELPTWFWDMPSRYNNLEFVILSDNNLTGNIPMSIGELQNLVVLDLLRNLLTGDIPVSIGKLNKLWRLDLSYNNLTGVIPSSVSEMGGLGYLDLSNNNLTGVIPSSVSEMGGLGYLDLSNNNLVGGIPFSLAKLYGILSLDLSGNKLSGNIIPTTILNSSSLQLLNLGGNNFSGDIAMSPLGSVKDLKVLNLSGNMFLGKFPKFIHNFPNLEALDLGFNNLHGDIPAWIGEIQGLRILRLKSNKFSGGIPPQLSNLKSLQVLDLAKNNLTGLIPEQLGGLDSMLNATQLKYSLSKKGIGYARGIIIHMKGSDLEFVMNKGLPVTSIDLSENKLSGRFPESLTNLSGLVALNLSRNFLTGTIPERIGNMRELESLDLSSNHFVGRLPPSMSSMSFLGSLNLSHNNFSGEIPAGGQMDTFVDASIFSSNPYLCGRFIERKCMETKNNNPPPQQVDGVNGGGGGTSEGEDWFYLGLGLGFAFGLLGPFLTMAAKRGWSEAYFRVVDMIIARLFWTRRRRC